ncbi:multicopper oxidase domain-containing protein [Rhodopseudomonas sp. HC1]|uniref:multicopper oxidase family protein n=1 Tax=Rhodopseudomonas infernalis TaxID=2897386 RepID=UPI001EE8A8B9|nr:multicopper oxidase domain-containing protein [Rhodopseudomonas infernalis]MCG6204159.1 multicopper oxidase domain-containing protein [Rhodopseudomonas infernalis]
MTHPRAAVTRRTLLAGLGGLTFSGTLPLPSNAAGKSLTLRAAAEPVVLKAGTEPVSRPALLWTDKAPLQRGDELTVRFENTLQQPVLLTFRGLDGAAAAEPLVARRPVPPGGKDEFKVSLRSAGTLLADLRLGADGSAPMPVLPLVVQDDKPLQVDGDEVVLIEDARLSPTGQPLAAGVDAGDAPWLYTINGKPSADITLRPNGRFRLRFINGCQRGVIAVRIDSYDVRVIGLDGQPAEPFLARGGTLVLTPGGRVDVLIDATQPPGSSAALTLLDGGKPTPLGRLVTSSEPPLRATPLPPPSPLPVYGLPAQLPLGSALRVELPLGALAPAQFDWFAPDKFVPASGPAFQAKRGRTVVLTLTNRATQPMVFHLHGHHFRLLDRLDDGWKPFWLDTLAIDAGQTHRIAFAAEYPGLWLMEAFAAKWSAPRLVRSYLVS